jgi:hypothetical protein
VLRVPSGERVLDAALLAQSGLANGVGVVLESDDTNAAVRIVFDYLDPRQGAVIEVIHTAESPEAIEATGTVIGIPKGIVRVTTGVQVEVPISILGPSMAVTVPTHTIPRNLRMASGTHSTRRGDLTLSGIIANALRMVLR